MSEQEKWAIIPDCPKYLVSDVGRVKLAAPVLYKHKGKYPATKCFVAAGDNGKGYKYVHLGFDGKLFNMYIHRLVAGVFIAPVEGMTEINHKNGVRCDNRVENLEWANRSTNTLHFYQKLGRESTFKGKTGSLNHGSVPIVATNITTGEESTYDSMRAASKALNIAENLISRAVCGFLKKTRGFSFKQNHSATKEPA